MGFPPDFSVPAGVTYAQASRGLGNAVCPPAGADCIVAALPWL